MTDPPTNAVSTHQAMFTALDTTFQQGSVKLKPNAVEPKQKVFVFPEFSAPLTFASNILGCISTNVTTPKYPRRALTYCTELFKGYPAVSVLVCIDNGLVHDLLELRVLQVVAYHHLQNLEELAIGDVAILVHVIDPKSNCGAGSGMGRGGSRSTGSWKSKPISLYYI